MIMLIIMYCLLIFLVIICDCIINEKLKDLQKRVMWLQTEFGRKIFL